jgi:hypothetical protein
MSGESWFLTCLVQAVSDGAGMSESASMVARRNHDDRKQQIPIFSPRSAIIPGESCHCAVRLSSSNFVNVNSHESAIGFELKHHRSSTSVSSALKQGRLRHVLWVMTVYWIYADWRAQS